MRFLAHGGGGGCHYDFLPTKEYYMANNEQSQIRDAIALLRRQLLLSTGCLEKFQALKSALQRSSSGAGVTAAVQALEPALGELARLEAGQRDFLTGAGATSLASFVEAQPGSVERDVALRLLEQVQEKGTELQRQIESSQDLLSRSKSYIDFNVNLMNGTAASTTYGKPNQQGVEPLRERKMFDANA